MDNLNTELNKRTVADFEAVASRDTSTTPTRNFSDTDEKTAISGTAKVAKARRGSS